MIQPHTPPEPGSSDASDGISQLPLNSPHVNEDVPARDPLVNKDGRFVCFSGFEVAKQFAETHGIAYSDSNRAFNRYNSTSCLWETVQAWQLRNICAENLRQIAHNDKANTAALLMQINQSLISGILKFLKGCAPMGEASSLEADNLAVRDTILDLSGDSPNSRPIRREDWLSSKIDLAYVPNAQCPRFLNELLAPALGDPDDLDLAQRMFGSLLSRWNAAQRIFIVYGPGGTGKSTLLSLMETLIGRSHFADLRTDTTSRFETSFYQGRSVLIAKDEKPDFLARSGAAMLKRLSGGDWIEIEKKFGGKDGLQEAFHIVISANTRLPIAINDDASAWRRRILPLPFNRSAPQRKIPRFDEELLREEGEGILAWLIEGYMAHKRDLNELGDFRLTEAQKRRIDDWVLESQSQRHFVETAIEKGHGDLSSSEIYEAFVNLCMKRGWKPLAKFHFDRALEATMADVLGVVPNHDIKRNGRSVRGYKGVKFTPDSTAA